MSNAASRSQNNIKAGIFVTVSIIVGLCVIFVLGNFSKYLGPSKSEYIVKYDLSSGVGGLGAGSFVKVGGIVVGDVKEVRFDLQEGRPLTKIDVRFSIPEMMAIRQDAKVAVQSGLLSTDSWLSFTSLGLDGAVLQPGDSFNGISMSMLDSMLGSDASNNLSSTLESLSVISERLEEDGQLLTWVLGEPSSAEVADMITGLNEAVDEANVFLTTLNKDWENWSGDIDILMAEAEDLAKAIDTVSVWVVNNETKFQDIVDNLDSALADASSVTAEFKETMWPKIQQVVDKLLGTLTDLEVVVRDLRMRSGVWFEDIDVALANLNLASQQLTQLLAEVTASPWRLLYRPTDKQYSQELVYEASRNFVFGAADLRSAAESMQRLMDARGDQLTADDPQLAVMKQNLMESARRYQRAQEQLMDLLRTDSEGSGEK